MKAEIDRRVERYTQSNTQYKKAVVRVAPSKFTLNLVIVVPKIFLKIYVLNNCVKTLYNTEFTDRTNATSRNQNNIRTSEPPMVNSLNTDARPAPFPPFPTPIASLPSMKSSTYSTPG